MKLFIGRGGTVRAIYSDTLATLPQLKQPTIERASNVEYDHARNGWTVTFPDGSALPNAYLFRADALKAEVAEVERRLRLGQ